MAQWSAFMQRRIRGVLQLVDALFELLQCPEQPLPGLLCRANGDLGGVAQTQRGDRRSCPERMGDRQSGNRRTCIIEWFGLLLYS